MGLEPTAFGFGAGGSIHLSFHARGLQHWNRPRDSTRIFIVRIDALSALS